MVMNDPIGDLLARIRNAQMRNRHDVITPASKLRAWVLDVLHSEGFIRGYKAVESDDGKNNIVIDLKYFNVITVSLSYEHHNYDDWYYP